MLKWAPVTCYCSQHTSFAKQYTVYPLTPPSLPQGRVSVSAAASGQAQSLNNLLLIWLHATRSTLCPRERSHLPPGFLVSHGISSQPHAQTLDLTFHKHQRQATCSQLQLCSHQGCDHDLEGVWVYVWAEGGGGGGMSHNLT